MKSQQLALIPTGFMVMMFSPCQTLGCRWPVAADDADMLRVVGQLTELLDKFPETRQLSTGYMALRDHLKQ